MRAPKGPHYPYILFPIIQQHRFSFCVTFSLLREKVTRVRALPERLRTNTSNFPKKKITIDVAISILSQLLYEEKISEELPNDYEERIYVKNIRKTIPLRCTTNTRTDSTSRKTRRKEIERKENKKAVLGDEG